MTNCYGNLYHHRSDATVFSPQRSWHPWLRHPLHTDISVWPSHEGHAQAMLILPRGWPIPSPLFPIKGVSVNRLGWRELISLWYGTRRSHCALCSWGRVGIYQLFCFRKKGCSDYTVFKTSVYHLPLKHRLLTFCFKSRGIVMFSSWSLLGLPLTGKAKTRWWIF